jgi:hypothetical protein
MTMDIEEELRELFHDKAAGAPTAVPTTPAAAPREVLRRGRLHQIGTVVGSALIAGFLVLGSVAGLEAILGERAFQTGPPGGDNSPSHVVEPRPEMVELSGAYEDQTWIVQFTGAFEGAGSPCIEVRVESFPEHHACPDPVHSTLGGPTPYLVGFQFSAVYVLAGAVPPEVADIRFADPDGGVTIHELQCTDGPAGWTNPDRDVCASTLPPEGAGTLRYLDAEGSVLFEEGLGWGSATAGAPPSVSDGIPTPVQPTHGGTYWAVYAWVGAPGDPAAEDTSAMLLDRFGIEAFPGDLACDQGAADALGTDAEQGVAVYFDTESDAELFVKMADLLGNPWDPVVQVTTYCLD